MLVKPLITSTGDGIACGPGPTQVTLTATSNTGIVNWYSADRPDGALLYTGTSYTTTISGTMEYWVEAAAPGHPDIISENRVAVEARYEEKDVITDISVTTMSTSTVQLTVTTANASYTNINWYNQETGGSALNTTNNMDIQANGATVTLSEFPPMTLYASAENACGESDRFPVVIRATPQSPVPSGNLYINNEFVASNTWGQTNLGNTYNIINVNNLPDYTTNAQGQYFRAPKGGAPDSSFDIADEAGVVVWHFETRIYKAGCDTTLGSYDCCEDRPSNHDYFRLEITNVLTGNKTYILQHEVNADRGYPGSCDQGSWYNLP